MGTGVKHITIVGGGLAGCLLANMMARRGFAITIFESRGDPLAEQSVNAHRSINLALSARGLHALEKVGLKTEVLKHTKAMRARCIHLPGQKPLRQNYGVSESHCLYAVERCFLHRTLVQALTSRPNVKIFFDHKVKNWEPQTGDLTLIDADGKEKHQPTELVIGADGAHSVIRQMMVEKANLPFEDIDMPHGYKELIIPVENAGELALDCLHIWPRESFMLIALPNLDNSFTCTLFLANEGGVSFDHLQTEEEVTSFFQTHFPDVLSLIPDLAKTFVGNPLGHIPSVMGYPWHVLSRGCLIGDAAHAIMPFYGQGMNCAFEDCEVLADLVDRFKKNWDKAFRQFERQRKPSSDAIAEMAMENYIEMRDKVADPKHMLRKDVEHYLMQHYPREFINQYAMVTFELVPYAFAQACGKLQNRLVDSILSEINTVADLDTLPHLDDRIHGYSRAVMKLKMTYM